MVVRGPVHDNALRLLTAGDLAAVCRWFGLEAAAGSIQLSEALPAATRYADLLAGLGPGRLAHIEFVRCPSPDLPLRMLAYRSRIMDRHPGSSLTQHVLVLAEGTVPAWLRDGDDLALHLHVTYLRDADPEVLLPDTARRRDLAQTAAVLAGIHLDATTIEEHMQEAGMPISFAETIPGRQLRAEGKAEGREQGRVEGRESLLANLLHQVHGDDPRIRALAAALAQLPPDQAIAALQDGSSLDDLADQHLTH